MVFTRKMGVSRPIPALALITSLIHFHLSWIASGFASNGVSKVLETVQLS